MRLLNQATYPAVSPLPALTPAFKIFTAYENLAAYSQAKKLQEQVTGMCRNEIEISGAALKFPLFRHEESWRHAAVEAATSEMIIIAASGAAELPGPVKSWIETWPRRDQPAQTALVVVLDPRQSDDPHSLALISHLRQVAGDRCLDFFCNLEAWEIPKAFSQPRGENPHASPNPICQRAAENWGIND